jgi:hypothetical protein
VPTALLNFKFSKLPQDRNSGLTVAVDADSGIVTLPITVTEKRIQIALIDSLMQGRTFTRSADMYSLFAFKISNEGFQDPLTFNRVDIQFISRTDTSALSTDGILNLIDQISVMNYDAARDELGRPAAAVTYLDLPLDKENISNPLRLNFETDGHLPANQAETVMILARFTQDANTRSFRVALKDVKAYDSSPDFPVTMVVNDQPLAKVSAVSPIFTTLGADPQQTFGNFPNPFGRAPH